MKHPLFRTAMLIIAIPLHTLFGVWNGPVEIFSAPFSDSPVVGVNEQGNAVIMASLSDDFTIFYQSGAQLIQGIPQNFHLYPPLGLNVRLNSISVNAAGNAAALWLEQDNTTQIGFIRAVELIQNSWSNPTTISNPDNYDVLNYNAPGIALDTLTNAVAFWGGQSINDSLFQTQSNRYSSSWQSPQNISVPTSLLISTALAGSPSGQAIAMWANNSPYFLQAAYFNGFSWTVANLSSDLLSSNIPATAVSMNSSNQAMLIWSNESTSGLSYAVFSNGAFTSDQVFYSPPGDESIISAAVALDEGGNAIAVWINLSDTNEYKILTSRFSNGGWSIPQTLDQAAAPSVLAAPSIGLDGKGNGYAVWEKDNSIPEGAIYYSQYTASDNRWLPSPLLLSTPGISSLKPNLSVNAFGGAAVVWVEDTLPNKVKAVFTKNQIPHPPQNFAGKQVKDKFLFQTDLVNILNWKPSLFSSVAHYLLYRGDELIATIPAAGPLTYQDHNRKKKHFYTYRLIAVNENGEQSPPVTLTLP